MNIVVAGTGYVGSVTGVCLAEKGHFVTCVDNNENKIQKLKEGKPSLYEPELENLMAKNKERLLYTTDGENAYKTADVIFIAVGTPEKSDGSANLSFVFSVAEQIAESLLKDCIVVVKSTVPIGTNDEVEQFIKNKVKNGINVEIASNPEFLAQGTAIRDTLFASRIIIGAESEHAASVLKEVYKDFDAPVLVTNRRSAEMIKYASNDFLALKISYINEIANLCEIIGADISDVTKGMSYDPRIGKNFLNAGIGYGGSCFPKDTKALHWLANYNDYELKTIKATIEVNENQKIRLIKKAKKYHPSFSGLNIAILGLTFKPGTDDLRESPSLSNVPVLLEDGANIKVWDPAGADNFKKIFPQIGYCETIEETLKNADLCFIFTEWSEIKNLNLKIFKSHMKTPIVLDGRNCFNVQKAKEAGLIYDSIGR